MPSTEIPATRRRPRPRVGRHAVRPPDILAAWFLQHALCVRKQSNALEVDPPAWEGEGHVVCRGRCLRCGTSDSVSTVLGAGALSTSDWWTALETALWKSELRKVFMTPGGRPTAAFHRCLRDFNRTLVRCVLLSQAGRRGVVH